MKNLQNDLLLKLIQIQKIKENKLHSDINNLVSLLKVANVDISKCNKCLQYGVVENDTTENENHSNLKKNYIVRKCNKCLCYYHPYCVHVYIKDDANICTKCKQIKEDIDLDFWASEYWSDD